MSTEQNKSLARRFYDIFNSGKTQALDEVAATNYIQHSPGLPPGLEGVKMFMGMFRAAFPDANLQVEALLAEAIAFPGAGRCAVPRRANCRVSHQPASRL